MNLINNFSLILAALMLNPTPIKAYGACPDKQLNVTIHADNYPTETTWNLWDTCANEQVNYGGPFSADLNVYGAYACVESDKQYEFMIEDSWGDGMCCTHGDGYYVLTLNGEFLQSGGDFGSSDSALFGNCDVSTPAPSPPTNTSTKVPSHHISTQAPSYTSTNAPTQAPSYPPTREPTTVALLDVPTRNLISSLKLIPIPPKLLTLFGTFVI